MSVSHDESIRNNRNSETDDSVTKLLGYTERMLNTYGRLCIQ